ncbi:MAG: indolepyruvate ferredoxin oxidoreductase subunit alpha [Clostridiaceae bacterium]|jgi:indolepyruvate ferredoxin oxidoreductase alpha subunit|nr:indolepyruvate ferredoxin oxidoreductase subunit alpha [Clostridiaceae bacterium]
MAKKLLMGNEAIAFGAMRAGVSVVTGYPGTPSTEVLETVAKHNDGSIYVEWSVNEKVALEVAAGAAYTGARTMVTMKQVGLNVASDPLMSLNYIGVKGGMVIVVADDPGPISSQTEQDTRHFGKFAKLAVFDPSTPEEAYTMIADAFDYSEKYGAPVLFRPTTRVCHSCASVEMLDNIPKKELEGFVKDSRWVIFPKLTYTKHIKIENNLKEMSDDFSGYEGNVLTGSGRKGIATGGVSHSYVCEVLKNTSAEHKLLKVSTIPFPQKLALSFLQGLDEVLVVEELDPVIENELISLCGLHSLKIKIKGKLTGHIKNAGENTVESVSGPIREFLGEGFGETSAHSKQADTLESKQLLSTQLEQPLPAQLEQTPPTLPVRPPVLCAGCPHRASFFAVKEATKGMNAVYSGDIGCYTLGNAMPLDMVDTCLCMGAGITIAQGLHRVEPDRINFAFVGDSTFFHTGISGIINAVYNQTDIIVVILDNSTTAMTGNQPHPGLGQTMMGNISDKISIYDVVSALNVSMIVRANPFDLKAAKEAVNAVVDKKGVRVILYEAPCIAVSKGSGRYLVDNDKCTGCKVCINKLGCPAIEMQDGKAKINPTLCTGCSICEAVCRIGAIRGENL